MKLYAWPVVSEISLLNSNYIKYNTRNDYKLNNILINFIKTYYILHLHTRRRSREVFFELIKLFIENTWVK